MAGGKDWPAIALKTPPKGVPIQPLPRTIPSDLQQQLNSGHSFGQTLKFSRPTKTSPVNSASATLSCFEVGAHELASGDSDEGLQLVAHRSLIPPPLDLTRF